MLVRSLTTRLYCTQAGPPKPAQHLQSESGLGPLGIRVQLSLASHQQIADSIRAPDVNSLAAAARLT